MNNLSLLRIGMGLIGLVILGEALALLVGMHFLSERSNPWVSFKNDLLLSVDMITGAGIIYFAVVNGRMSQSHVVYFVVALALLTHGYRAWEYWVNVPHKFCINTALFAFNSVKLVGLLVITGAAFAGF